MTPLLVLNVKRSAVPLVKSNLLLYDILWMSRIRGGILHACLHKPDMIRAYRVLCLTVHLVLFKQLDVHDLTWKVHMGRDRGGVRVNTRICTCLISAKFYKMVAMQGTNMMKNLPRITIFFLSLCGCMRPHLLCSI